VLVGQSGVGKSSLVKSLLPDVVISIGDLVGVGSSFGAHTTSSARLYHLQGESRGGGRLIDSPGIRELGIWHLRCLSPLVQKYC
jgi:ribosome biogenesis GTPase / thiamine phosphate phosphatase